jgi:hypothetical protein
MTTPVLAEDLTMRIGALTVPVIVELAVIELNAGALRVVTARFLAGAASAVVGALAEAGAVPSEGRAKRTPEVVDGAVTTPLLTDTELVIGVLITGIVVPAVGVAEVIDAVARFDALAVDAAVVTALDTDVGTAIPDMPPPPPPLVITGTGSELTELFTVNCGLAIGGTN